MNEHSSKEKWEIIRQKLNEIDQKVNTTSYLMFSYIQAILALMTDKELTTKEEFEDCLTKCKEQLAKSMQDVQFSQMMKDVLPDDQGEKEDRK